MEVRSTYYVFYGEPKGDEFPDKYGTVVLGGIELDEIKTVQLVIKKMLSNFGIVGREAVTRIVEMPCEIVVEI